MSRRWCCSSRRAHRRAGSGTTSSIRDGRWATDPLNDNDLAEFVALQAGFAEGPKSWTVEADEIDRESWDLSVKNPNREDEAPLRDPEEIIADIAALDAESAKILAGIRGML